MVKRETFTREPDTGSRSAPTLAIRLAVLQGQLPAEYIRAVLRQDADRATRALAEAANVPVGDA